MVREMIEYSLGALCISTAMLNGWKNTYQEKAHICNAKNIIVFIAFTLSLGINYKWSTDFLKLIISNILMIAGNYFLYKKSMKITILSVFATEIVTIIAETVFAIGILSFSRLTTSEIIMDTYFGTMITNLVISILVIMMTLFNFPRKLYKGLTRRVENINDKQIYMIMSFVIMTINVLFSSIYYQMPLIISMVLNTIIMTIYGYIILKIMNEHNENLKVFEKYKKTAESLNEYQDTVNKYRLDRHENKNQLETIEKLAIRTNNQEILEYVQVLLDKKNKNKPQVKIENIVIPDGWLETTLYTKMETMEEKKIKYNLSIDKLVKTTDLIDIDESTMLDICNILNIFMDNAIEAVADHRKGNIKIRFYKETKDYLNISVINSCKRMIDIGKIGINGYSDKGDGRGYGLACVKETIRHNKRLLNETVVKEESFTQILKIKM